MKVTNGPLSNPYILYAVMLQLTMMLVTCIENLINNPIEVGIEIPANKAKNRKLLHPVLLQTMHIYYLPIELCQYQLKLITLK